MAQSPQKSYTDMRQRDLEFQVNDGVFLKVGHVAYELELPQDFVAVHPVSHVSRLRKFLGDPSLVVPTDSIIENDSLTYEEVPMEILDHQVRKLRTKEVAPVKVLWRSQKVEEAMWEEEEDIKSRYPHLFEQSAENVEVSLVVTQASVHSVSSVAVQLSKLINLVSLSVQFSCVHIS
ncbi:uncharacterized protein LOC132601456 [Lycium barbarum]|uniref:uncharacterized protein LOC132601456 n=1 Tax=Lycium barbarum TaxID=112863 RepID=UPI00293F1599|nr:uncharacterized protein LOC132601456 [Lycium barbarum]